MNFPDIFNARPEFTDWPQYDGLEWELNMEIESILQQGLDTDPDHWLSPMYILAQDCINAPMSELPWPMAIDDDPWPSDEEIFEQGLLSA